MSNIVQVNSTTNALDMFDAMKKAYEIADLMAKSDIIPTHFRGKTANIFIVLNSAYRMNIDPMLMMQNTFVISGKLGMNAAFAISLANRSGLFSHGIRYRIIGKGSELAVTAYTNLAGTGEEISYTITMKEATADGWTKNPKYQSLPELMLRYRAATLLIRTHAPEVMNGMQGVEELEDVRAAKDVTPQHDKITNEYKVTDIPTEATDYSLVLKNLCKVNGISVKEFANYHEISGADPISLKRGIDNFDEYLSLLALNKQNTTIDVSINEIQEAV